MNADRRINQRLLLRQPHSGLARRRRTADGYYRPDATLVGNLGAESIDFLDIVYNLEKTFDVEIPRGDLIPDDILTNVDFLENGRMNAAGLTKLRQRMPFADLAKFEANPVVADFANLLTVNDMCGFVDGKLKKKAA